MYNFYILICLKVLPFINISIVESILINVFFLTRFLRLNINFYTMRYSFVKLIRKIKILIKKQFKIKHGLRMII